MVKELNIVEQLREERLIGVNKGEIPEWMTTHGYMTFKNKYVYEDATVRSTFERIAKSAAKYTNQYEAEAEDWFFKLLWNGWLAPSTPVLANMGTDRGCPVSCSGGVVGDSIHGFYSAQLEAAMLSKNGFGTSNYLGDIRGRGERISKGGKASGVKPVFKDFVQVSRDVSQGNQRRGAWAGYLDIDHPDFYEVVDHLAANPDDLNIGWNISRNFINRLDYGDKDALMRWQRALKVKCITGKGYFVKIDHMNEANPPMYKAHNLSVKASNLCTEIALHADENHTFTCVLSSMNASKYDEWKNTDAVFWATVFLDCVAEEFIQIGKNISGLEKAVRFTQKGRALGLGLLGYHTYIQSKMIPFEDSGDINKEIFSYLDRESLRASQWMAQEFGEPEWCKGYHVRNTHRIAVAPNTTSALVCGGVSQGIEPVPEIVYVQPSSAGELERINPVFLEFAKERGRWNKTLFKDILKNNGSVQHLDWLTEHEKRVFKTAFEIDQYSILKLASDRQVFIDQAQSINLFFDADASEQHISAVHKYGMKDERIKSLYYMRSKAGIKAAEESVCEACEG